MMIRKTLFWLHLSAGVAAGLFIVMMAATGVILAFQRQILEFVDRDFRAVSVPNDAQPRSLNELLETVRRSIESGEPTAITVRPQPQAAVQFSLGRSKTVYVDPYSGAVLGVSSPAAHEFFLAMEQWHRALGAPPGSKSLGHWLAAVSNLLFSVVIILGVVLWVPRQWSSKAVRAAIAFRSGLRGRAREWNWHNVLGIWCALPLLVIALTGVVMSFEWANTLLFRLTGSPLPVSNRAGSDRRPHSRNSEAGSEPNYDHLFAVAKTLNSDWHTISINVVRNGNAPIPAIIDTGTGGQPQKRTQYLLSRSTGALVKSVKFADGSLGQKLRAFVRFGHTGEVGGWVGQAIAALASLAACVLAYTGLSLTVRRLAATIKRRWRDRFPVHKSYAEQPIP